MADNDYVRSIRNPEPVDALRAFLIWKVYSGQRILKLDPMLFPGMDLPGVLAQYEPLIKFRECSFRTPGGLRYVEWEIELTHVEVIDEEQK